MNSRIEAQQPLTDVAERISDWLGKHLTPVRFLVLAAVVSFAIAWNRDIALLYGLTALILSLLLISWVAPWWLMRQVSLERTQRGIAQVGGRLVLDYRLAASRPLYFLTVVESLPGSPAQPHFLPHVIPDEPVLLNYECHRRGVHTLPTCGLMCGWPFGFIQRQLQAPVGESTVVVWPRVHRIRQLPQLHAATLIDDGHESLLHSGAQAEYAGVRPYRQGDSMKHVHWGATARLQEMVVREYHSYEQSSWLIVVDANANNHVVDGDADSFEMAIEMAASVLNYGVEQQQAMTLVVTGDTPLVIHLGTQQGGPLSPDGLNDALAQLAAVNNDGQQDWTEAVENAQCQVDDSSTVLMTIRTSKISQEPSGPCLDVVINAQSFEQPMGRYAEGWEQCSDQHQRLNLHRLSKLERVLTL